MSAYKRDRARIERAFRRDHGLCVWCRVPPLPAVPGKAMCAEHAARNVAAVQRCQRKRAAATRPREGAAP